MSPEHYSGTSADSPRPDILTCGSCSKEFLLANITSFIAHKVDGCRDTACSTSQFFHHQDPRTQLTSFQCSAIHTTSQENLQQVKKTATLVPCPLWLQDSPPPAHSTTKQQQFISRNSSNLELVNFGTAEDRHDQPKDLSLTCSKGFKAAKSGPNVVNNSLCFPTDNKQSNRTILNSNLPKKRKISISPNESVAHVSIGDRRHTEVKETTVTTTSTNSSVQCNNSTDILKEDKQVASTAQLLLAKFPEKHEKLKQLLDNKAKVHNHNASNLQEQESSVKISALSTPSLSPSMAQQPNLVHFTAQVGSAHDENENCSESYIFHPSSSLEAMKENVNADLFNKERMACPKLNSEGKDTGHLHKSSGILTVPDLNNTESINSNSNVKSRKLGHFLKLKVDQTKLIEQPASSFTYKSTSCRKQNGGNNPNCESYPFYIKDLYQSFDSNNSQNSNLTEKLTETLDIPTGKQLAISFRDIIGWGNDPSAQRGPRVRSLPAYNKSADDPYRAYPLADFPNPPTLLNSFKSGWKYLSGTHGEQQSDCDDSPSLATSLLEKTSSERPPCVAHPKLRLGKAEKLTRNSASRSGISSSLPPEPPDMPITPDPEDPEDRGSQQSSCSRQSRASKKRRYPTSRPFKCDSCEQAFNQRIHLKKHMSKHTGVKPFQCQQCGYSTVERSHLKVHVRVHTGEKPYRCLFCDYATAQNSTLKIHLKRHHEWLPARQFKPSLGGSQRCHQETRAALLRDTASDSSESLHSWSDLSTHRTSVDTLDSLSYPGRNLKRSASASDAPSGRLLALTHPFHREKRMPTPKLKSSEMLLSETEAAFSSVSKLSFLYGSGVAMGKSDNSHVYHVGQDYQTDNLDVWKTSRHNDKSQSHYNTPREPEQTTLLGHKQESDMTVSSLMSVGQYLAFKRECIASVTKDEEATKYVHVPYLNICESNYKADSLLETEKQISYQAAKSMELQIKQPKDSSQGWCLSEINDFTSAALSSSESMLQKSITDKEAKQKQDKTEMKMTPERIQVSEIVEAADNEETPMEHPMIRVPNLVSVDSELECRPVLVSITIPSKEFVRG